MKVTRFTLFRIIVLLACLASVATISAHQRDATRSWEKSIEVSIFPINADGTQATQRYIDQLDDKDFGIINRWGAREAKRYSMPLEQPFNVTVGDTIDSLPPQFPGNANSLSVLFWGLKLRYWAWRHTPDDGGGLTRVRMFVLYHEGNDSDALEHSVGLQKGLIGLVHAFSDKDQTQQNNIVIAHELLHTVGAVDKYDLNGNPVQPVGLAHPNRRPMYPQRAAEIMSGRIPRTALRSTMAESLKHVVINPYTATEINWIK